MSGVLTNCTLNVDGNVKIFIPLLLEILITCFSFIINSTLPLLTGTKV